MPADRDKLVFSENEECGKTALLADNSDSMQRSVKNGVGNQISCWIKKYLKLER